MLRINQATVEYTSAIMNQVIGRIEGLNAKPGLRPSLEIQLSISNPNDIGFDFTWLIARATVAFFDISSQPTSTESPQELGFVFPEYGLISLGPSGKNSMALSLPVDAALIADLEEARKERDVTFSLYVSFTAIPRTRDGALGNPFGGSIADERYSSQAVIFIIPKSLWMTVIQRFTAIPSIYSLKELSRSISETNAARKQAEQAAKAADEAAKAAKGAATLTAVTNLAQAYQEEAVTLKHRSWIWAILCILIAAGIAYGIYWFIRESLIAGGSFTTAIAILRAVVLAVGFGMFSLCLRVYESYRHLEVVNRHRVNIGRTFEAFKAAQPTERAQEIMSAITAENMLTFGKSGFAPKDSPNQSPLTDFSELVKSVLEKKT